MVAGRVATQQREWAKVSWDEDGRAYAARFKDWYFGEQQAYDEARYVFCGGLDLPNAWNNFGNNFGGATAPATFSLVELGFGAGVNFLQTKRLWKSWRGQSWRGQTWRKQSLQLDYYGIEKYPMRLQDLQRTHANLRVSGATASTGQLLELWRQLERYPQRTFFRWRLSPSLRLTLLLEDAAQSLARISAHSVDGWYLDGFAIRDNPSMWSEDVFSHIGRCTRARFAEAGFEVPQLASFSVARSVRERAASCGFRISKRVDRSLDKSIAKPRKREVLQGFALTSAARPSASIAHSAGVEIGGATRGATRGAMLAKKGASTIAVVGGGIAALCARVALRKAGFRVLAIMGERTPMIPSRMPPRVVVCPRLQRGDSREALFIRQSFLAACSPALSPFTISQPMSLSQPVPFYLQEPWSRAIVAHGALRLAQDSNEQQRMRALAEQQPQFCRWLEPSSAARKSGLSKAANAWGGSFYPAALTLEPQKLFACEKASSKPDNVDPDSEINGEIQIVKTALTAIKRVSDGYRLFSSSGEISNDASNSTSSTIRAVVLAVGSSLPSLLPALLAERAFFLQPLLSRLRVARGRIDHCARALLSHPPLLAVCASGWVIPWTEGNESNRRVGVVCGLSPRRERLALEENRKRLLNWCQKGYAEGVADLDFGEPYIGDRLATNDRLPLLGKIATPQAMSEGIFANDFYADGMFDALYLFGALAGHGYLTAPLCADILARTIVQDLDKEDLAKEDLAKDIAPDSRSPLSASNHHHNEQHSTLRSLLAASRFLQTK